MAVLGEAFGVRTAWHGPGDVSPVGHAANVTLDLVSYNFGVQEYSEFNQATQDVFPGCPVMKNGFLYANEAPGWGIEVNDSLARKFPFGGAAEKNRNDELTRLNGGWGVIRRRDGTVIKQ
jgi:mannonate dehydratase